MPDVPFTIRRTVRWGECDPAAIVYTPRFLDYAMEAAEDFYTQVLGIGWYRLRQEYGLGSPLAHVSLDFHKPLYAEQPFEMAVAVDHVGRSAITLVIRAHDAGRELCFEAKLVTVIIDRETVKSTAMPEEFRERLDAYRRACEEKGR